MAYKDIKERKAELKAKILEVCPKATEQSGIYIFVREENGFKYAYIGQAKHILTRLADHLDGHEQHIDLSLKKHKLYSLENPCGWRIGCLYFNEELLNEKEQYYIKLYANNGYQLRNKTSGSQDGEKFGIAENKSGKGYWEGVRQGEKNAFKTIKVFFDKYLDYGIKEPSNKVKERKFKEFEKLLKGE